MLVAIIGIAILVCLLFLGIPFVFAMALAGLGGAVYLLGWDTAVSLMADYGIRFISPYVFGTIPLFVLMGALLTKARTTDDLFDISYKWFGRVPGGLAVSVVGACSMFGAITGVGLAALGAMGKTSVVEMRKRGYYAPMAAACVATSSNLGYLIPPSTVAIIYAMLMSISAGKQLMAGLLPGILNAALYMIMIVTRAIISPSLAPAGESTPLRKALASIPKAWPAVIIFILVIGGIYTGTFTPTEAAAIGAVIAFILLLGKTRFHWPSVKAALTDTVYTTGMAFGLLLGASMMKLFLSFTGVSQAAAVFFGGLDLPVWAIMLMLTVPYLILGMFIDTLSIVLLTIPIYAPIIADLGIDPFVFGVVVAILCNIAYETPPLGFNILFIHGLVPDVPLGSTFKQALWFISLDMVVVVLLTFFPIIATLIPSTM